MHCRRPHHSHSHDLWLRRVFSLTLMCSLHTCPHSPGVVDSASLRCIEDPQSLLVMFPAIYMMLQGMQQISHSQPPGHGISQQPV